MSDLMILLAICFFVLQTLALKLVKAETLSGKLLSNCFFTLLASAVMFILYLFLPRLFDSSASTLLCGGLFGLCFALTILFYLSAISCGPLSYTSFYLSASMLLPTGAGILFFHEKLSPPLLIALLFFLAAFYCLNVTGENNGCHASQDILLLNQKAGRRWLTFCLLTFICNGSCGIVQKTQQYLTGGTETFGMMLTGFFAASICYGAAYFVTVFMAGPASRRAKSASAGTEPAPSRSPAVAVPNNGYHALQDILMLKKNLLPVCLLAVSSLSGNLLLTRLSGQSASSYLFPLVQGSIILGVTLCSVLFFKEKLTLRGKLGILAGTAGIIIINL